MPRDWLDELRALADALDSGLPLPGTLRCVECTAEDERAAGWRTYLTMDDDLATYCPECARKEFYG